MAGGGGFVRLSDGSEITGTGLDRFRAAKPGVGPIEIAIEIGIGIGIGIGSEGTISIPISMAIWITTPWSRNQALQRTFDSPLHVSVGHGLFLRQS